MTKRAIHAEFNVKITTRETTTANEEELSKGLQVIAIPTRQFKVNDKEAKFSIRDAMLQAYGKARINKKFKVGVDL